MNQKNSNDPIKKIANQIAEKLSGSLDFRKDLQELLILSRQQLIRYKNFLNRGSLKAPIEDSKFLKKFVRDPKKISSIQSIVALFIKTYKENTQIFYNLLNELYLRSLLTKDESKRIKEFIKGLSPFLKITKIKHKKGKYKDKLANVFTKISTACKLKVQFEKDSFDDGDKYYAGKDIVDVIPVADIQIRMKIFGEDKSFIFQIDRYEIDEIIEVLQHTKSQLIAISKNIKLKK